MKDLPALPPGFTPALLFNDPTPNMIIVNRIAKRMFMIAANCTDLGKPENREDSNDFIDLVILISRKMASVWNHLQAYHAHEKRLVEEFSSPRTDHEFSQDLFEEFDVFAVQIKSTLDHLVKTLRPMIGRKWTMYTFGDKGETVFNSLKRNTSRKFEGRVRMMEHLLYSDHHKQWLGAVIDSRDRMNHGIAGGMDVKNFAVFHQPDGTVSLPRWSSAQSLADAMDGLWNNFFHYVEDWLACALYFRILDQYAIVRQEKPLTSADSSWNVMDQKLSEQIVRTVGAQPV